MAMTENGQLYLPGLLALNDLLGLGKNLSGGNHRENPASKTCNRAVSINYQKNKKRNWAGKFQCFALIKKLQIAMATVNKNELD